MVKAFFSFEKKVKSYNLKMISRTRIDKIGEIATPQSSIIIIQNLS
jgi:hypothetical protein